MLQVPGESFVEVIFPIVAIIDKGDIDLTVSAITQVGRDEETATLTVVVSGDTDESVVLLSRCLGWPSESFLDTSLTDETCLH